MYIKISQGKLGGTDYSLRKNKLKRMIADLGLEFEEFDYAIEVVCMEEASAALEMWLDNNGMEFIDEDKVEHIETIMKDKLFEDSSIIDEEKIAEIIDIAMKDYAHLIRPV